MDIPKDILVELFKYKIGSSKIAFSQFASTTYHGIIIMHMYKVYAAKLRNYQQDILLTNYRHIVYEIICGTLKTTIQWEFIGSLNNCVKFSILNALVLAHIFGSIYSIFYVHLYLLLWIQ